MAGRERPWERVWQPPPPAPPRDILAEERSRPRRMWWPGNWFRGRRAGLWTLAVFAVLAAGYLAWARLGPLSPGDPAPPPEGRDHPEAGRRLTPSEHALGLRYGRPLFLGDRGLPVVRLESTGEVRELTPLEAERPSSAARPVPGRPGLMSSTGPRGWGLWWEEDPEERVVNTYVRLPRMMWWERQQEELEHAADRVSLAMDYLGLMEFRPWRKGVSGPVHLITEDLKVRHPVAAYGHWSEVPGQWVCSGGLEADLNQGVTQGCPGDEYMQALSSAWFELGHVVYIMNGMGRLGVRMDRMDAESLYQSEVIIKQAYHMADLLEEVEELDQALRVLAQVSHRQGLPITALLDFG